VVAGAGLLRYTSACATPSFADGLAYRGRGTGFAAENTPTPSSTCTVVGNVVRRAGYEVVRVHFRADSPCRGRVAEFPTGCMRRAGASPALSARAVMARAHRHGRCRVLVSGTTARKGRDRSRRLTGCNVPRNASPPYRP